MPIKRRNEIKLYLHIEKSSQGVFLRYYNKFLCASLSSCVINCLCNLDSLSNRAYVLQMFSFKGEK